MDRGDWRATVYGFTKSWTQLSDFHSLGEGVLVILNSLGFLMVQPTRSPFFNAEKNVFKKNIQYVPSSYLQHHSKHTILGPCCC